MRMPRPLLPSLLATLALTAATPELRAQSSKFDLQPDRAWTQTEAPPADGDAAVIARARRALAEDNPYTARGILNEWLGANERTPNPYLAQAYLLRGDAYVAMKNLFDALYDYESLIKQFPQSEEFVTALDREMGIALRYVNGEKRQSLLIFWVDASDIGVELLIRIQERLPGSQLAERAAIELADFYYRQREVKLSGEAYDLYLLNFPKGPNRLKAAQRRIYCDIARFKGPRYDSSSLLDAEVRIKEFARRNPDEAEKTGIDQALLTRLDESAAAQMLDSAKWYLKVGEDAASRFVMKNVLKVHPGTIAAEQATSIMKEKGWWEEPAAIKLPEPKPEGSTDGAAAPPAAEDAAKSSTEPAKPDGVKP